MLIKVLLMMLGGDSTAMVLIGSQLIASLLTGLKNTILQLKLQIISLAEYFTGYFMY